MKNKWNEYIAQLEKTDKELDAFFENSGLPALALKAAAKFVKEWNALKKQTADFDKYISPVDPMEIVFPFKTKELEEMWQRWKEYLSEQHGQLIRTRAEKSALEYMEQITGGDETKAVKFLRYAMANRYRNFFVIEDSDTKKPAKNDAGTGSDF